MSDDRLDRLERMIETLVDTVQRGHNESLRISRELAELARTNAVEHTEFRRAIRENSDDIKRLYQAFSDHYREHGEQA